MSTSEAGAAQPGRAMEPVGKAALIASVGGARGYADWTNPDHRLRRLLAEFLGMAALTRRSWPGTAAAPCSPGRRCWCSR